MCWGYDFRGVASCRVVYITCIIKPTKYTFLNFILIKTMRKLSDVGFIIIIIYLACRNWADSLWPQYITLTLLRKITAM